jgi:ankyrin repeat protein
MSHEDYRALLTPTGELILKERNIKSLTKISLNGISERILHLDLRNNQIRYLENSLIPNLTHLRSLDLRCNKLEVLSEQISYLIHLKTLKLDHNLLTALPLEVFKLPLSTLTISDNSLFAIPSQIRKLKSLCVLSVSENQIKSLPAEIGDLELLKILHIHNNEFSSLPSTLGNLFNLEELSLEWFRYTLPPLTKMIKGHIGESIISSFRDLCEMHLQVDKPCILLESFLKHFSENEFDINRIDVRQRSLIHLAVSNGDVGVINGLIESGCDLNLIDLDGFTPLVIALKEDNIRAAKIVAQAGARLDIGGGSFGSVLNLAVIKSEPWLVNTVIKSGIDPNSLDNEGNTCLHHLMTVYKKHKHKNALIADMIVEAGVRVNTLNNEKWAAVHIAARRAQASAFRWIASKNKSLKASKLEYFNLDLLGGCYGWAPLHVASHSGHYKTVESLIVAGAQVYITNFNRETPKDISKGDASIYKLLTRAESLHIKMIISQPKTFKPYKIKDPVKCLNKDEQGEYLHLKYKRLYEYFYNNDTKSIENILKNENSTVLKTDAVYLLSILKQRKAARILLITVNSEESLLKTEAALALQNIKSIDKKISHSNSAIGPKLSRSSPLQISLPVNADTTSTSFWLKV